MITSGPIATATRRLEKPSGVPRRFQCVATVGGRLGYAQTEIARATTAITRPNQRLRMRFPLSVPAEAGHEVAQDFLKYGRVQPVADELPFALRGHQVRRLEHAEVMRHRRKGDGELLGDLPRGAILLGEELEDPAAGRIGEGTEQRVIHRRDIYTIV